MEVRNERGREGQGNGDAPVMREALAPSPGRLCTRSIDELRLRSAVKI